MKISYSTKTIGTPVVNISNYKVKVNPLQKGQVFDGITQIQLTWTVSGYIQQIYEDTNNDPENILKSYLNCEICFYSSTEQCIEAQSVSSDNLANYWVYYYDNDKKQYDYFDTSGIDYCLQYPAQTTNISNVIQFRADYSINLLQDTLSSENTDYKLLVTLKDEIFYKQSPSGYKTPLRTSANITKPFLLNISDSQFQLGQPVELKFSESGYTTSQHYGLNLNNNDIVKVNGLYFNEDSINHPNEGIHFYSSKNQKGAFDVLYGFDGQLFFKQNIGSNGNITYSDRERLCYTSGQTIKLPLSTPMAGTITNNSRVLMFTIPLTKPILNSTNMEVNGLIQIRGPGGYIYIENVDGKKYDGKNSRANDHAKIFIGTSSKGKSKSKTSVIKDSKGNEIGTEVIKGLIYKITNISVTNTVIGIRVTVTMPKGQKFMYEEGEQISNNIPVSVVVANSFVAKREYTAKGETEPAVQYRTYCNEITTEQKDDAGFVTRPTTWPYGRLQITT